MKRSVTRRIGVAPNTPSPRGGFGACSQHLGLMGGGFTGRAQAHVLGAEAQIRSD